MGKEEMSGEEALNKCARFIQFDGGFRDMPAFYIFGLSSLLCFVTTESNPKILQNHILSGWREALNADGAMTDKDVIHEVKASVKALRTACPEITNHSLFSDSLQPKSDRVGEMLDFRLG